MCYYSTRTATVRVTQLESIPLGRLLPHNRESHTLIRITKICSVTELAQVITPAQYLIHLSKNLVMVISSSTTRGVDSLESYFSRCLL